MSQDHTRHITDEELLLDYYGEGSGGQRAEMRAHLETCQSCQALDHELRGVLALVDTSRCRRRHRVRARHVGEPRAARRAGSGRT